MRLRILPLIAISVVLVISSANGHYFQATTNPQVAIQELDKLAPGLREQAKAVLDEGDDRRRSQLAVALFRRDPRAVTEFLLAFLQSEKSATVRVAIIDTVGRVSNARIREELARVASSDPEVRVSLLALERLRSQLLQEARDSLTRRLELARRTGDDSAIARLAAEQERWISLLRGVMLPSFLRVPPARFSAKPDSQTIRVLAFGDFGTGSVSQKQTAAAMIGLNKTTAFDFALTLGDNFYPVGMSSPGDSRWKEHWADLYDPLGIKFYASLGNHDWASSDSPAAEILYSERSPSWRMPSPYYTFIGGPVQFFALDTNEMSDAQLMWLDGELKRSTSKWKIVYGHHPIYSDGDHGDSQVLIARLLPLLKNRVDLYLAGHDHVLNYIKPESGVHFFVSGGGGATLYKVKTAPRTLFAQAVNGFSVLEADANALTVKFVGVDQKQLYEHTIRKGP